MKKCSFLLKKSDCFTFHILTYSTYETYFCVWRKVLAKIHYPFGYLGDSSSFTEKVLISPMHCNVTFVINHVTTHVGLFLDVLVPLIYLFTFVPIPCCPTTAGL